MLSSVLLLTIYIFYASIVMPYSFLCFSFESWSHKSVWLFFCDSFVVSHYFSWWHIISIMWPCCSFYGKHVPFSFSGNLKLKFWASSLENINLTVGGSIFTFKLLKFFFLISLSNCIFFDVCGYKNFMLLRFILLLHNLVKFYFHYRKHFQVCYMMMGMHKLSDFIMESANRNQSHIFHNQWHVIDFKKCL